MFNVQENCPNVAHVFQLVRLADKVIIDFVDVHQVCPRGHAKRNKEQCQRYLNARVDEGLAYLHLHTGTPEEASELIRTLKASYPGIGA